MTKTSAYRTVATSADAVFATLVDVPGLPAWNDAIDRVIEAPASLSVGDEWVVELAALGQRWPSRSRVLEIDPAARVFAYRSRTDDGNPSYVDWRWEVTPAGDRARVAVSWDVHPLTFWRRLLLVHIRKRQLARSEVPHSLDALAAAATARA